MYISALPMKIGKNTLNSNIAEIFINAKNSKSTIFTWVFIVLKMYNFAFNEKNMSHTRLLEGRILAAILDQAGYLITPIWEKNQTLFLFQNLILAYNKWTTISSFSSCQRNWIKTFQIEAMIALITKMVLILWDLLNGYK